MVHHEMLRDQYKNIVPGIKLRARPEGCEQLPETLKFRGDWLVEKKATEWSPCKALWKKQQ